MSLFVAGVLFGDVQVSLSVPGAIFGEIQVSLFVAGAIFGDVHWQSIREVASGFLYGLIMLIFIR